MGADFSAAEVPDDDEVEVFDELYTWLQEQLELPDEERPEKPEMLRQLKEGWATATAKEEIKPPLGVEELQMQLEAERSAKTESDLVFMEHIGGMKEKLVPALRRVKMLEEQLVQEREETQKVRMELVKEIKDRKTADLAFKNRISALEGQLLKTENELEDALVKMETFEEKVKKKAEIEKHEALAQERKRWIARLRVAEEALFDERREKLTLESWLTRFQSDGIEEPVLDHAEMAMSQFSRTIAYAPLVQDVDFEHMCATGVLSFLIRMLHPKNNTLVLGPAALAMSHLSRGPAAKLEVAKMGGLAALLNLCKVNNREPVITQVCRTIASVGMIDPVKVEIAQRGGIKVLCYLISFIEDEDLNIHCKLQTEEAQAAALHSLVNLSNKSDANRTSIAASGGVESAVQLCRDTNSPMVLEQCAKLLANLAFNHTPNQTLIASIQGDDALTDLMERDELGEPVQVAAALAIANMTHSERNQAQVGAGGAMRAILRMARGKEHQATLAEQLAAEGGGEEGGGDDGEEKRVDEEESEQGPVYDNCSPAVAYACSMAIGSMCFQSFLNKNKVCLLGAARVLVNMVHEEQPKRTLIMVLRAITTSALTEANQRAFEAVDALSLMVRLVRNVDDEEVLEAATMALVSLAPDIVTKRRLEMEGRKLPFQIVGGVPALERANAVLYNNRPPPWLLEVLNTMKMRADEKYVPKSRRFTEIYPRWHLAEDLVTEVEREVDAVAEQQNEFKFVE